MAKIDPDSVENDDSRPIPELHECPLCGFDSRTRDPHTQAKLRMKVDRTTPCGKPYGQWYHFGCLQMSQIRSDDDDR